MSFIYTRYQTHTKMCSRIELRVTYCRCKSFSSKVIYHEHYFYQCNLYWYNTNLRQLDLHNKSSQVFIKTSPPASLTFKGQVTEQTTVIIHFDRLQNSRIFYKRERRTIRKVWSEWKNGEGEWWETLTRRKRLFCSPALRRRNELAKEWHRCLTDAFAFST